MDLADKPKRSRKPTRRKVGPMPSHMKAQAAEAERRKESRPINPGVMLEPLDGIADDNCRFTVTAPHTDIAAWEVMIADAFGTRSRGVFQTFLDQLRRLCRQSYDFDNGVWKPNETELNAALAIVHGTRPKDEISAMLAAGAVATHWMQMRAASHALQTYGGNSIDTRTANTAARLSIALIAQLEAIDRRQRRPRASRQVITVKRETHHHTHKHVHFEGGGGVTANQPHVTGGQDNGQSIEGTAVAPQRAALPSPQPGGEVVPLRSGEGQAGLLETRRRPRLGRA